MDYLNYIIYALLVWNLIVFFIYGVDKTKAKRSKNRISEKALLLIAFLMGSVGALLGMLLLRHKTKHWKFKILVPLFVILNIAAAASVYIFWLA